LPVSLAFLKPSAGDAEFSQGSFIMDRSNPIRHIQNEAIGSSGRFLEVMCQVAMVAATDSSVLIQGETGTGKEVIAKAIHAQSARREAPFIKMNCAAIPAPLLESELFGHEKGAFTGAISPRVGRFEAANGGTLFLDEIGDMPIELQPKLLRVLQEREFERLGSSRTVKADVRLIAATNQDLPSLISAKKFRLDLYYRLDVIKIEIPPLRQRAEDIPLLAYHFVRKYAQEMDKEITTIPAEVLDDMKRHDWPGNVRELQNFIERAVIMSSGPVLSPSLADLGRTATPRSSVAERTLAEVEREHILEVLEESGWMIGGFSGAAARLGLARSTLIYKMQKLGIEPRQRRRAPTPRAIRFIDSVGSATHVQNIKP
jgi:formate hydrogenlyase transcriptional activator